MEHDLLKRAKNGDRYAFDRLAAPCRARLMVFCAHYLTTSAEAEDAVQEILVLAWKHLVAFHEASSFSTWLYRIARNYCLNRLRTLGNHLSLDQIECDGSELLHDYSALIEEQIYSRQVVAAVMNRLNERDRIILWLHFREEMTSEDIAQQLPPEMKLSDTGVRTRLKRHIRPAIDAVRLSLNE